MMPFVKVTTLADLPLDSVLEVHLADSVYALCNNQGTICALSGVCLHQGGPLGQGQLAGGRIICPWHAWEYDCRTGQSCDRPEERVATYEVKVDGNDVLLRIP